MIHVVVPAGMLAECPQTTLEAEGGSTIRPWADKDAPVALMEFQNPAIQPGSTA